jgi:hypothetical protein
MIENRSMLYLAKTLRFEASAPRDGIVEVRLSLQQGCSAPPHLEIPVDRDCGRT